MKVHKYIVITDPNRFLETNGTEGMSLFGNTDYFPDNWIVAGEVDLDLDVDINDITMTVIDVIKGEIKEKTAKHASELYFLNQRLQELTALPAPEDYETETQEDCDRAENHAIDSQEHSYNKRESL